MGRKIEKNRYDKTGENLKRGMRAQELFEELAKKNGWKVIRASQYQDMNEHWDCRILKSGKDFRIEIKAMKKISRKSDRVQSVWHWIELHGVREHDKGWLYGGKSDYIAFETEKSFILVNRKKLIEFVENAVDFTAEVKEPYNAKYKIYRRKNRYDILTLIKTEDLKSIATAIWDKSIQP